MAIQQIQEFRQKDGTDILKVILKPTKAFPNGGYFYAPVKTIELVQERSWCLVKRSNRVAIEAHKGSTNTSFHQELCYFYHSCYVDCIDHINMIEIDNTDDNLNVVTSQQNQLNTFTRGYGVHNYKYSKLAFQPMIRLNGQVHRPFHQVHREDEACVLQYQAETDILKEMMGDNYYQFDFKKYRRGASDILDLERTGKISSEEATYRHILRYAENAWYMLRYDLEEYYKENNIPIPKYALDEQGFMVHPITNEKLCPFAK